jgi:hypothetical protein
VIVADCIHGRPCSVHAQTLEALLTLQLPAVVSCLESSDADVQVCKQAVSRPPILDCLGQGVGSFRLDVLQLGTSEMQVIMPRQSHNFVCNEDVHSLRCSTFETFHVVLTTYMIGTLAVTQPHQAADCCASLTSGYDTEHT